MGVFRYLHQLVLGVWMGGLLCFGAVVAPALFRALTPAQAGAVVRQVIPALDVFGLFAAVGVLSLGLVYEGKPRGRSVLRAAFLAGAFVLALASAAVVTPRLAEIRREANDQVSALAPDDPLRREFGRLHGVSTGLMLGQLLLAFGASLLPLRPK
ncbi:MAG: DUF4149 domain-containing protein [Myxococcota bacterium]